MLTKINPYSFVDQDYIWMGEYSDGTHLSEYHYQTKKRGDFNTIRKESLIRFGLIGNGMRLYHEVLGGFFHLRGQIYEIVYKVGDKEYYLTGQSQLYNDVITYKDAEAWANFNQRDNTNFPSRVTAFNTGYKKSLKIDGINFNFKAIISVPCNNAPINLTVRIVADTDLDGRLVIKRNGTQVAEFDAPLRKGMGGQVMWYVRW